MALVRLLLGVALVAGGLLCVLGYRTIRQVDEPGATAFGVFAIIWGAIPIITGTGAIVWEPAGSLTGLLWIIVVVPWVVFALQYTGVTFARRTLLALVGPSLGLVPWLVLVVFGNESGLAEAVGVLVFVYYSALAVVGAGLVVRATSRYGHLSLVQGLWLAVAGVVPPAAMNTYGIFIDVADESVLLGIYAASIVGVLLAVSLALFRYDVFGSTPAAGTVGERAVARETDDLVLIVDDDSRLIKRNETATRQLAGSGGDPVGSPLAELVGVDVDALQSQETVELQTADGVCKFDPQVSPLTDQHGRTLGSIVSLRDVTEREMRRQRLEVFNRLLRHNLRNQVTVIKANTEAVADELTDDELGSYLDTATASADALQALGRKAKTIEELLSKEGSVTTDRTVGEILEASRSAAERRWPSATVEVAGPTETRIEVDRDVLRFIVDNLVENAVEHSDREQPAVELTVDVEERTATYPVTIAVADDGPGIPEREIEVLREGTETPQKHGSGVGLWVTNWAVTHIGGELAFADREPRGSIVRVRLPVEPLADSSATADLPIES